VGKVALEAQGNRFGWVRSHIRLFDCARGALLCLAVAPLKLLVLCVHYFSLVEISQTMDVERSLTKLHIADAIDDYRDMHLTIHILK
jgi:hypothetical protein